MLNYTLFMCLLPKVTRISHWKGQTQHDQTSLPLHVQEVRRVQAWELGNDDDSDDGDDDDDDGDDHDDGGIPGDGSGVADNCHVDKWEWNCRSG